MKRLPPFGKSFQPVPISGVRVVIGRGPSIWEFANNQPHAIMVLPEGENPSRFQWPSDNRPSLVHERGEPKGSVEADRRLDALAKALLIAGASSIVALREAYVDDDPRVFFDPEVQYVSA